MTPTPDTARAFLAVRFLLRTVAALVVLAGGAILVSWLAATGAVYLSLPAAIVVFVAVLFLARDAPRARPRRVARLAGHSSRSDDRKGGRGRRIAA